MSVILLKQATAFCPERFRHCDILIKDGRIEKTEDSITATAGMKVIDCSGLLVLPGLIDAHVHFREPGYVKKGTIASESAAAALGGVTSYMEMPNTNPPTVTAQALSDKKAVAAKNSLVNYAFHLGGSEDNLEEIKRADPHEIPSVKIYMGSTTGNLLLEEESALLKMFSASPTLITVHCEDNEIVNANTERAKRQYGSAIPFSMHPVIRSRECCIKSSQRAIDAALSTGARLHIMHLSCAEEINMIRPYAVGDIHSRQISAEACIPHMYFNESDYDRLKGFLKCNPAVKYERDRLAIMAALRDGVITTIGTDHAPHEKEVKVSSDYLKTASGLPSVQFSLQTLLKLAGRKECSTERLLRAATSNVAERYGIVDRGSIKEGFYADLAIVDPQGGHTVKTEDIASICGWSPFAGERFNARVVHTIASGNLVVENGRICSEPGKAMALRFNP